MGETIRDIIGMAVCGVVMTIAVPFAFALACLWQLYDLVRHEFAR